MSVPDPEIQRQLAEVEEEERLSRMLGVDLRAPFSLPVPAPGADLSLYEWLRRSEEIHQFLRAARRAERSERGR